jgi:hypothetical protein
MQNREAPGTVSSERRAAWGFGPRVVPPMIDLHAHILPGVDDGPATVGEVLADLRAAAETPYVGWPLDLAQRLFPLATRTHEDHERA